MSERLGDWLQTASGRRFWPLDPRPDEIDIQDIAHALSHQGRFAGHSKSYYSTAEHSVRVAWLLDHDATLALWGLLHDIQTRSSRGSQGMPRRCSWRFSGSWSERTCGRCRHE